MCLRLNTSASITVQRVALFAGAATSKTHVTGRVNTWSGATMINRRLLIYGAPKAATGGTLTVGNVGGFYGYSDGTEGGTYGAITPNPRTISGKTGTVKVLYMTGRTYITMYIMWDGPGFPTDLIVSFATTVGEPLPDVTLSYVDFMEPNTITIWYDMSPWGQIYYVTGADAGAPELWNWITGNPGEIIGFNFKVVSI